MKTRWMTILVTLALFTAFVGCNGPTENTVDLAAHGRPIINGEAPDEAMHDAVVSLHTRAGDSWYPNIYCSGTLIAPDVILTAAHCLNDGGTRRVITRPPEEVVVYIGDAPLEFDWDNPSTGELHLVVETMIHPSYSPTALTNDMAMIRLAGPSAVTPVPALPAALGFTAADEGNLVLNFAGFGADENDNYDIKLQIDGVLDHIQSAGQIYYFQADSGPCFGDSGGPAFVKRGGVAYVGGMTSYGDADCAIYGVSTRADAYETMINDFIGVQGPYCGDDTCDAGEDCSNCAADCGACPAYCGDGNCDAGELCDVCIADCGTCPVDPFCGDGTCDPDEDCVSCATDCGACPVDPFCGDGTCDPDEDCSSCEMDCGECQTCLSYGEYCTSGDQCCSGRCHWRKNYCK